MSIFYGDGRGCMAWRLCAVRGAFTLPRVAAPRLALAKTSELIEKAKPALGFELKISADGLGFGLTG